MIFFLIFTFDDLSFSLIYRGATHSKLIICDENGAIVSSVAGPSTNHWMVGIPECANRIAKMVEAGKSEGKIPQNVKLKTLGLSLSGCEQVCVILHQIRSLSMIFL